jgi:hypothetical protein
MGNNFACEGTKITQPNEHFRVIRVIHGDKVPYKYTKRFLSKCCFIKWELKEVNKLGFLNEEG